MTTEEYIGLITAWQRRQPKFVATVAATVAPFADAQVVTAGIPSAFDLDTAVGVQLDILGQWIGRTRTVPRAYLDTYFRLDDAARGLDIGVWKQPFDPDSINIIADDDFYWRLLNAKIFANQWDGTGDGLQAILDNFFTITSTYTFVQSGGDTVYAPTPFALDTPGAGLNEGAFITRFFALDTPGAGLNEGRWRTPFEFEDIPPSRPITTVVGIAGDTPPIQDLAALAADLVTPKPAGGALRYTVSSVDGAPIFALDSDNLALAGLDQGAFGVPPEFLVAQAA